jgi:DivIVA domain-containing protein
MKWAATDRNDHEGGRRMTVVDGHDALLPLHTGFDVVWRGYDRDQVGEWVDAVEADFALLAADRDAAESRATDLARALEVVRAENVRLRAEIDRLCRTPVDPAALDERLRRAVELAHRDAAEITGRARATAERIWTAADEEAGRLRGRYERLVEELDAQRRQAVAEHTEVMRRAQREAEAAQRQAEQRRRALDEEAARLRERERADFEVAMAARRREATAAAERERRAAREEAERLLAEAREEARHLLAEARAEVERLTAIRRGVSTGLLRARALLDGVEPLLHDADPAPVGLVAVPQDVAA